jgi:UDP-N-acetylglucosamine 2-epimerase
MSELFFRQLAIPEPDRNLEVGSGPHGAQTGAMLAGIESVALTFKPDWVLIYGDTNSTLAGALAGAKLHVRVAHVEAGLRSFDRTMPEEVNRVLADHVSSLLLCPTENAVENLAAEGITTGVQKVGDVMFDAFIQHLEPARRAAQVPTRSAFDLLTVHRAENVDNLDRLRGILDGVGRSSRQVLFPVHPRTKAALDRNRIEPPRNVTVIDPVGYLEMLVLEDGASLILTDSGGVQKEAYFAGRPCITLRDTTEWPETVTAGWNVLVGADPERIARAIAGFRPEGTRADLFGDGHAAERVVESLNS